MPTPGKRLDRLEARYRMLAEQASDMISIHAPDGSFLYVSQASRQLLGREPASLIGTQAYDNFHPADLARIAVSHDTILQGVPWTVTYRIRHADGHYVWVETTNQAICDPDTGAVTEIVCTTRRVEDREAIAEATDSDRAEKLDRVRAALAEGAIRPAFQPICELGTREPIAFEALARFDLEPQRPPDVWFAEAEEVGLRAPLELRAIDAAIDDADLLPDGAQLAVNVSPDTVQHHTGKLARRIGPLTSGGRSCVLEITEHAPIADYEAFDKAMRRLRDTVGVRLAVDDAGAGFASLTHILRLHPDVMKLDRSVVAGITEDARSLGLARAIVVFSEEIATPVVAEGIEDEPTLELLREIGVGFGQGYLLGRPAQVVAGDVP